MLYRDAGPERTILSVAQKLHKTHVVLQRWAKKYNWYDRVAAWNHEQDTIRLQSIQKGVAKAAEKTAYQQELTDQRILLETARIAFSDIRKAMRWDNGSVTFVASDQLDDDTAAAIESVSLSYDKKGRPIQKLKMYSKLGALEKAGEYRKLWGGKRDEGQGATTINNYVLLLKAMEGGKLEQLLEKVNIQDAEVVE